jgi:hypothetical protein
MADNETPLVAGERVIVARYENFVGAPTGGLEGTLEGYLHPDLTGYQWAVVRTDDGRPEAFPVDKVSRHPGAESLADWERELLALGSQEVPLTESARSRWEAEDSLRGRIIHGPSVVVEIGLDEESSPWDVAKLLMQAVRQITKLEDDDFHKDFPRTFGRLFDKTDPEAYDAHAVGYWEIRD